VSRSGQAPGSETDEASGREKSGEGERNGEENGDESSIGGRCQKGVITWRQTDSIVNPELEPAVQHHAQGADMGPGPYSHSREAHRRDAHRLLRSVLAPRDDLPETGCA